MNQQKQRTHQLDGRTIPINIDRLEHETDRLLAVGIMVAIVVHAMLFSFITFEHSKPRVPKPFITQLIIRPPRPSRPYTFTRQHFEHRDLQRRIMERMPSGSFEFKSLPTPEEIIALADDMEMVLTTDDIHEMVAGVMAEVDRRYRDTISDSNYSESIFPDLTEYLKGIEREMSNMISLRETMLTVDDLYTGQYRGLVIKDPFDKKNVKGFIHIPSKIIISGSNENKNDLELLFRLKRNDMQHVPDEAVTRLIDICLLYTGISLTLDKGSFLNEPVIQKYPLIHFYANKSFELSGQEQENMETYFTNGGFAMIVAYNTMAFRSITGMMNDIFGDTVQIKPVPDDHPILHCFFDFNSPVHCPVGEAPEVMCYMNGVFLNDKLVAVILNGEYGIAWIRENYRDPFLPVAVNVIVYSLIKQDSIAQQYINDD